MKINFFIFFLFFLLMNKIVLANLYKYTFKSIDGDKIVLNSLKGKPLIIVNTASFCGYTYQYQQLQNVYNKYKDKGLIIIGIPSNDFGNQEFSSNKEVKDFCEVQFNVTFTLAEITKIKGKDGHPFFKWIKKENGFLSFPKWNFYKYIFDKEGNLTSWFSSVTKPESQRFLKEIEKIVR